MSGGRVPVNQTKVLATDYDQGRPGVRIHCDCGGTDFHGGPHDIPLSAATNWFRQRGWTVGRRGQRAECPDCKAKAKGVNVAQVNGVNGTAQSTGALRQQRILFSLLEEHFDPEVGVYEESAFGALQDPAIAQVRAALFEARANLETEVKDLYAMVKEARDRGVEALDKLDARLRELEGGGR